MDGWQNVVGQLVQLGLPTLGGLVGNLVVPGLGGVAGSAIGKAAAGSVAGALGVEVKPEAVSAAITADPSGAALKLAQVEAQHKDLAAYLADVADARATTVQLAQANSKIAYGAPIISVVVMAAFFVSISLVLWRGLPSGDPSVAIGLVEVLKALTIAVVSYWVGSSESSRRNAETVRNVAQQSVAPTAAKR